MSRPWHKRWHGNALNGMRGLSLELRGAYNTILDLTYDHGGPIRLDERRLCGELDCDVRVFRRVLPDLIKRGKLRLWADGQQVWLVNDKALEELKIDGFEPETSAELPAEVRDKFGIAIEQLSPKSSGKPNKNSAPPKKAAPKSPLEEEEEEEPPQAPFGGHLELALDGGEGEPPDPVAQAFEAWNELARRIGLPVAKSLDEARRRAIANRLEDGGLPAWAEALAGVEASAFLRGIRPGRDGRTMKADLGFVCQAKSFPRLREGFYGSDAPPGPKARVAVVWTGPPEIRAAIVEARGEAFAKSYVDRCKWTNGPLRQLSCANPVTIKKLKDEVGDVIARFDATAVVEGSA